MVFGNSPNINSSFYDAGLPVQLLETCLIDICVKHRMQLLGQINALLQFSPTNFWCPTSIPTEYKYGPGQRAHQCEIRIDCLKPSGRSPEFS